VVRPEKISVIVPFGIADIPSGNVEVGNISLKIRAGDEGAAPVSGVYNGARRESPPSGVDTSKNNADGPAVDVRCKQRAR